MFHTDHSDQAQVLAKKTVFKPQFMPLVERTARLSWLGEEGSYHYVALAYYVATVAVTPGGEIPIVRQFRATVESLTWELPAGILGPGESVETASQRESLEETGLQKSEVQSLSSFYADTGLLNNQIHLYVVRASEPPPFFKTTGGRH